MLINLLTAAVQPQAGNGFFGGIHGGIAAIQVQKVFENDAAKTDFAAKLAADPTLVSPEITAKATNAIIGVHVGLAQRVAKAISLGAALEGTFLFGENLKVNSVDTKKDAQLGVNILGQARFHVSPAAFFGIEAGLGSQQIKLPTTDTKWAYSPVLGGFFGLGIGTSKKTVLTANVRYAFPIKQGTLAGVSSKPSSIVSTIGVSYYFA